MEARATVIIPTFSEAPFAKWAIKSVQRQTVSELEICVICDGSPAKMVSLFNEIAKDDNRIRVFTYPKSPRTGEPYRDEVIRRTSGKIVCYCAHDDLWLPWHVETMEQALQDCGFTHSIHTYINPTDDKDEEFSQYLFDFSDEAHVQDMIKGLNYFGLSFVAHTREFYFSLDEGWTTTPIADIPTDLYMWQKFIRHDLTACKTMRKVTALCFPKPFRKDWSPVEREQEIMKYSERLNSPVLQKKMDGLLINNYVAENILLRKQVAELKNEALNLQQQNEHCSSCILEQEVKIEQLSNIIQAIQQKKSAPNILVRIVHSIKDGSFSEKLKGRVVRLFRKGHKY